MFRILTEGSSNGGLQVETDSTVVKNGLYLDSDGEIRYYIDGTATYMGLIYVNGYYYYIRSSGVAARDTAYWVTNHNGLMESGTYYFDEFGRMTNPPDGSYVATSSGTGIRVDYTYDANGMRKTKTVTTGTLVSTPRHGLHWDEDGVLRYYENGYRMRVGLIWVDGHYYYIKSDGTAVRNQTYWVSHNNGLMPSQDYTFNEYGWLTDPVTDEDFDVAMSTHDKVSETLYFDWVVDDNNATFVTYTYTYNGGSLTQMTVDDQTLSFAYDGSGRPMAVTWNGTTYLYLTNIQGDVIAILDTDGNAVVQYTYDAWGNILTTTGTMADTLGTLNPLTYRGYVYDQETQLYYLQSRYYNPTIGRFINADALVSTGQGTLGNNMFAYCLNNPTDLLDLSGYRPVGQISCICIVNDGSSTQSTQETRIDITEKLNTAMYEHANDLKDIKKNQGFFAAVNYFINCSKSGGAWDLKSQSAWNLQPDIIYVYDGDEFIYDDIGNIHYGYVGRVLFKEKTLLFAAGVVQIAAGTSSWNYWDSNFDDPRDQFAISYGYSLWWRKLYKCYLEHGNTD